MESEAVEQTVDEEPQEAKFNVIPVQLVESYESVSHSLASQSNASTLTLVKGKYYKQTYRPAWEQMADFQGWLRGVEGEPTRAYCTYCHKTLHAHRLSLLKHTCTIRHQKAAQIHSSRKNKSLTNQSNQKMDSEEIHTVFLKENDQDEEIEGQTVEFVEAEIEDEDSEHESEDVHEDDYEGTMETEREQFQKNATQANNIFEKPPISTHVIDTMRGKPVMGLQVSLYKLIDGRWTYINEGVTNPNGRFSQFLERCDFTPGRYKLHYDVDRYFEARKQSTLYPFIEIVFDSTLSTESYHIPMLLSPFGYTTYKGS